MKTIVTAEFNDREKAALEIIANISCSDIVCAYCPFRKVVNDSGICIKDFIEKILKESNT